MNAIDRKHNKREKEPVVQVHLIRARCANGAFAQIYGCVLPSPWTRAATLRR